MKKPYVSEKLKIFKNEKYLVWSKDEDEMPLMNTQLSPTKPCLSGV
jgi:hypothetical protein